MRCSAYRELAIASAFVLAAAYCIVSGPAAAADAAQAAAPVNLPPVRERIVSTRTMTSASRALYKIFVSVPAGPPPAQGFPVVYVIDGNAWFAIAADIARLNELTLGPVMVVGIGYPTDALLDNARRAADLTPPGPAPAEAGPLKTGGADTFLQFIDSDVRPQIASEFKIDPARQVLFGHSLGGLFVLYAMFEKPTDFDAYIAASPSIWWSDGIVLKKEDAFEKNSASSSGTRILLTAGEFEHDIDPTSEVKLRRIAAAHPELLRGKTIDETLAAMRTEMQHDRMIENAQGLADRLSSHGLYARFALFPGEDHNSEAISALNRGIPFALDPSN